jgi:hypothetical protein
VILAEGSWLASCGRVGTQTETDDGDCRKANPVAHLAAMRAWKTWEEPNPSFGHGAHGRYRTGFNANGLVSRI